MYGVAPPGSRASPWAGSTDGRVPSTKSSVSTFSQCVILVCVQSFVDNFPASFCAPVPRLWKTTPSIPLLRGTADPLSPEQRAGSKPLPLIRGQGGSVGRTCVSALPSCVRTLHSVNEFLNTEMNLRRGSLVRRNQDHGCIVPASPSIGLIDECLAFAFRGVGAHRHQNVQYIFIIQHFVQAVAAQENLIH